MCGPAVSLSYAPRTLFAVSAGSDGPAAGADGTTGGSAPTPPSGPSPQASWRNLKQPMPLGRKIRLVVRNTSIKIKTHQQCCGHPGEPGC